MSRWALLLVIVSMTADAGGVSTVRIKRGGASSGGGAPTPPVAPLTLCEAFLGSDAVGGWWCLNGDGTMEVGSAITMVANGSTTDVMNWDVCGGTGCYQQSHIRMNPTGNAVNESNPAPTTAYYTTASTSAAPTGSFTTCWLGRVDKPAANGNMPDALLLSYSLVGGDEWRMTWATNQITNGLRTLMLSGLSPCSVGGNTCVDSAVQMAPRQTVLQCSMFDASVGFTSCTYTQGTAGAICVSAASATAAMSATPRKWQVGAGNVFGTAGGTNGFIRGALMTEKVLSTADVTRIGAAVLPPAPPAMLFTRASPRTCGNTVELAADVPCIQNYIVDMESASIEKVDQTEQFSIWGIACCGSGPLPACAGPCNLPTTAFGQEYSPYGMKSVYRLNFAASGLGTQNYSIELNRGAISGVGGQTWTYSFQVKGVPGVSDTGTIMVKGHNGNITNYYATCSFTSAAFTNCELNVPMTGGNGAPIAVGVFDNTTRPAMSVYVTNVNVKSTSPLSSYVRGLYTFGTVTRAVDVCAGVGCPPSHIY